MPAKAIMVQGTGSHVGKSLLATALCRILTQDGYRVLPFKAQNMSNNASVTTEGGEISRAQAEQAKACGVEPSVLMNPILLKPTTDVGAQVIVLGKPVGTMSAREYQAFKPTLRATVVKVLHTLREQADILVIEGAGSPAEINLKADDLVNMWVAKEAKAQVVLVGDIDRGGVFAQLVGTMELLDAEERALVRGFFINKFRGDFSLLEPGIRWLEARSGLPVLGTIPYLHHVELAEEDTVPLCTQHTEASNGHIRIDVLQLPRISNFTDVDPLARDPQIDLRFITRPTAGSLPDCVIVPGSKSTIADLAFVRAQGLADSLHRCVQAGGEVVGLCGGFQMLGQQILDPEHLEATVSSAPGLGLLPGVTLFHKEKTVAQVRGLHLESGLPVAGYEIHMGRMQQEPGSDAVFKLTERGGVRAEWYDGLQTPDGRIWGTHLHGLFDLDGFRGWWLNRLRQRRGLPDVAIASRHGAEGVYDRLAETVRAHLSPDALAQLLAHSP